MSRYANRFIANSITNSNYGFLFDSTKSDNYPIYKSDKESLFLNNSDKSYLMDFLIRMDHNDLIYDRRYKKIQDVLAQIGGLIQVLYLIFYAISYPIISKGYFEKIINSIYNFEDVENKRVPQKQIQKNSKTLKFMNSLRVDKKSDHMLKSLVNIQNKSPLKINYWEFLKNFLLSLCKNKKSNCNYNRIKKAKSLISKKLDVSYLLKKFYEIDKLKMLLFNENQYHLFEYLAKPVILKNSEVDLGNSIHKKFIIYEDDISGKLKKMCHSYHKILNQNELSDIDKKLLNPLDDNLKNVINKEFFCQSEDKGFIKQTQ